MSTAWVTIAVTDLYDYLVAAQVSALNTAALGVGQTNRFTQVMTDVVNKVRLAVETCTNNRVSTTALTVPPSLRADTCYLIIANLQGSIPSLKLSDDQRERIKIAEKRLELVASCDLKVETPTDPLEPGLAQGGAAIESITSTTRKAKPSQLDGL